jgi:hypothetical protein
MNYDEVLAKAKRIDAARISAQSQVDTLSQQLKEAEKALIDKYGPNYMERFEECVAKVQAWDEQNATA